MINAGQDIVGGGIAGTIRSVIGSSKTIRDPDVKETLSREGFVTGFELSDSGAGKLLEVSSGLKQENATKTEIALRGMRTILTQEGYISGVDGLDSKKITDAWKKFKQDKAGDPDYIVARDEIKQNTKIVSDVSRLSRLTTAGLYNLTSGLKSFPLGVISQTLGDAGNLINYIAQKSGLRDDKTVQ